MREPFSNTQPRFCFSRTHISLSRASRIGKKTDVGEELVGGITADSDTLLMSLIQSLAV